MKTTANRPQLFRPARALLVAAALTVLPAAANVKIGFITTLSTPAGYLGQDARDGFLLAVDEEKGRLGGIAVQVLVEDDKLQPAAGKQIAEKLLQGEKVRLFSGLIFSNVSTAVVPDLLAANAIFISPNAAPSGFAGKGCHKNYYVASWQNDSLHAASGALAQARGYKRMVLLAPNYQAGKDAIHGFKTRYQGAVLEEIYTNLNATDFAAEMARIRFLKPDAVYQFHPGGSGIAFIKQYAQAGLKNTIPMVVPMPGLEARILAAVGDDATGLIGTSHWNSDFENPVNKAFVEAFRSKYNREPTPYAAQGYDTAKLIGAALKATGGKIEDPEKFRGAMLRADTKLTRGNFKFGQNQHPIHDWYQISAVKGSDGKLSLKTGPKILSNEGDPYAQECKL
jgi:branched-chain amino acid transport system substrate-binding protein